QGLSVIGDQVGVPFVDEIVDEVLCDRANVCEHVLFTQFREGLQQGTGKSPMLLSVAEQGGVTLLPGGPDSGIGADGAVGHLPPLPLVPGEESVLGQDVFVQVVGKQQPSSCPGLE